VLGLGGLGHFGVQYATKDGQQDDRQRGAGPFGGFPEAGRSQGHTRHGRGRVLGGLTVNGTLTLIDAAASLEVSPVDLLRGRRSVKGWYAGTSIDSQDTLAFGVLTGVRSMNE
jgi:D-arabinose 1-dehydrogenase-like Zn-dependent alcohol dehydrogenase